MKNLKIAGIIGLFVFASMACQNSIDDDEVPDTVPPTAGTAISFTATSSEATTVVWGVAKDDETEVSKLQYKVVKAATAAAIDTKEKADKIAGADLAMNWTAKVLRCPVKGLEAKTTYFFAVLVRDEAGNIGFYAPKSVKTAQAADKTAPTVGNAISFAGTSATSTTVKWGPGKDDTTGATKLQYKLVKASSSTAVDTVDEVNKVSGANLVMDWTANTVTNSVTGLTASTTYWFAVLVKDAAGNTSIYAPKQVKTSAVADTTAPTVGTAISFSGTSATSTTVSWGAAADNVTPAASLQYKLVKANAAGEIDSVEEADAIAVGDLVMGWTANQLAESAGALTATTTYWFAVLVKDAAGNRSLYAPKQITTTAAADTTDPTVGTAITFSGTASSSRTVTWGAATDNITPAASLQYKLVCASASTSIDTVAKADAVSGAGLVMDWAMNDLSEAATGLTPSTTYWFAVLVKDAAGNKSLYAPQSITPTDTTLPTVGTAISFSGTTATQTIVSWGRASDDVTSLLDLEYKLVKASASTSIDTVAKADAIIGGDRVVNWMADLGSATVTELTANTTYWFAVLVRDGAGNMSLYAPKSVTTLDGTPPTVGTDIVFSGTTGAATTVSWGAATDNITAAASLQYKLVRASASTSIDTTAKAEAITSGANLVMDWTANDLTQTAAGLSGGTTYWFAVLVKDEADNMSLYAPKSVTTAADTTPPTTTTAISFSGTSATSTTVSWGAATDNVTATSSLQYKLVWSLSLAPLDTVAEANGVIADGGTVMDWTTNTITCPATGLTAETNYYFAVLVRDGAGNMSLYAPQMITTSAAPDTTAPTVGTVVSFSGTSATTTTVSWGAASDNVTPTANLQYKLVRASASGNIDTVGEADAISGGSLVMNWTAADLTETASGLTAETTYWFAVIVRDGTGNMSLYAPKSVTTSAAPDTTAPTVGTAISFSGISNTATTVNWGAASDNVTATAGLQYKLVRASASGNIDTVGEANAISGGDLVMDWTTAAVSRTATGLTAGTTYWFAVIVRDGAGNISLYAPKSVTTTTTSNLIYNLNTNPGWTTVGDWQWGTVSSSPATYSAGGTQYTDVLVTDYPVGAVCYGTKLNDIYSNGMNNGSPSSPDYLDYTMDYLQTGPLNLSGFASAAGFRMTFKAWFHIDCSYDMTILQYSTNGSTFADVGSAYISGYTYRPNMAGVVNGWSPNPYGAGDAPAWQTVIVDLGGLGLNGSTTVYFRWALSSDAESAGAGFYVDDIDIGY